jgi:hypothetical protein
MKIPFEGTISGAYRFAFSNILSIIGIGWFPFLLFGAVTGGLGYLWLPRIQQVIEHIGKGKGTPPPNPAEVFALLAPLMGTYVLAILLLLVVQAMVNVGVMRKALGQHPEPVFFFFSLGSQVWRLIGSYFLLGFLFYGVGLVLVLGIAAISFVLQKSLPAAQVPVTVVLGVVAFCWAIYAGVRVMFFIPAVVVAENHIGIRRSWHLGRGNFWRIVGIWLIVTIPVQTAFSILTSTIVQIAAGPGFGLGPKLDADPGKVSAEMMHLLFSVAPYLVVLMLLYFILLSGLVSGAIANAYNLVTGDAPPEAHA